MAITDKEISDWLNSFPTTEETLKKIHELDLPELDRDPEFIADLLKGMVTEDILRAMEEEGLNRNQLAKRLDKSRQYVGRVLNETANFTLKRLAEFACVLNRKIAVRLYRKNEAVVVKELSDHGLSDTSFKTCEKREGMSQPISKQAGISMPLDNAGFASTSDHLDQTQEPANEKFKHAA